MDQITDPAKRATKILPQYYAMTASAERLQELEQIPGEKADAATDWNAVSGTFSQIQLTASGSPITQEPPRGENDGGLEKLPEL